MSNTYSLVVSLFNKLSIVLYYRQEQEYTNGQKQYISNEVESRPIFKTNVEAVESITGLNLTDTNVLDVDLLQNNLSSDRELRNQTFNLIYEMKKELISILDSM